MDFQKSKVLLEKINALYKNMSGDPRNISSIERDLMRSYILQFYESFLELPTVANTMAAAATLPVETKAPEPKITLRRPETMPPPAKPQPEPPKPEPPKVEEQPAPAPPPPPPPVVEKPPVVETPPPPPPPVEEPPAPTPVARVTIAVDPEVEDLFAFKTATELSEKLSELPIADIKKAMGLNERISTQNELFGGDAPAFDTAISTLNQLKSYDEAKDYLIRNAAAKYNWTARERKSKAKEFIKLVRRRY